jgi:hypothetical protein
VPPKYRDNPNLAFYATSGYGLKFLSLTLPNLVGNIGTAFGGTNP